MREKIKKMNIILNYFNYKYNGNWEMVYSVIKNRTNVNVIELEKIVIWEFFLENFNSKSDINLTIIKSDTNMSVLTIIFFWKKRNGCIHARFSQNL